MTTEKAIRILRIMAVECEGTKAGKALEKAIEALEEKQRMEDDGK